MTMAVHFADTAFEELLKPNVSAARSVRATTVERRVTTGVGRICVCIRVCALALEQCVAALYQSYLAKRKTPSKVSDFFGNFRKLFAFR